MHRSPGKQEEPEKDIKLRGQTIESNDVMNAVGWIAFLEVNLFYLKMRAYQSMLIVVYNITERRVNIYPREMMLSKLASSLVK
jgi:hypothetical protein